MRLMVKYDHPLACVKPPSLVGDAGFNVVCVEQAKVLPNTISKISLGFSMAVPQKTFCTMIARSSAVMKGLFVLSTIIDEGYRGPMFAFVFNMTADPIEVIPGDMIAQLVLLPNLATEAEIDQVDELPPSDRGANGFGSTGTVHVPNSNADVGAFIPASVIPHIPVPTDSVEKIKPPYNVYVAAAALADVCGMGLDMNKAQLLREAKLLHKEPVRIRELFGPGSPWYRYDFRGKQNSYPTPAQVRQTWLKMEAQFLAARPTKQTEDGGAYL